MLLSKWIEVRENFQRIQDIFDDPYTFHYVGFLNFCGEQNISDFLKKNKEFDKSKYVQYLRNSIRNCLCHKKIEEYNYNDSKNNLLRVFILHNIETILHRYELLKKELNLKFYYEYFPFELLYSQTWDIEHIASQTDNELKRPEEVQDFEEAEDQLCIQCYDTSKKYHSMGLDENTIRLVLSKKGIQN